MTGPFSRHTLSSLSRRQAQRKALNLNRIGLLVVVVLTLYIVWMQSSLSRLHQSSTSTSSSWLSLLPFQSDCTFRSYPPKRYYGILKSRQEQPDFLTSADYIYGQWPTLLQVNTWRPHAKLCLHQDKDWLDATDVQQQRLPFADGTNPSILRLDRIKETQLHEQIIKAHPSATFLATLCLTDSQCSWMDTAQEKELYRISTRSKPVTVRTILLVLDAQFTTLSEASIVLEKDANWGSRVKKGKQVYRDGSHEREIRAFDDARLFLSGNNNEVWVSYREGRGFGWDRQVLNPIHVNISSADKKTLDTRRPTTRMEAKILASETTSFCCGRNMALMQHHETGALQSLTWVDPVTVIDVVEEKKKRRLSEEENNDQQHEGRRLVGKKKKSHFHGTNAFMVPFGSNELLGMGHFHRPPGRDKNDYARFGHHYTHAFFTITARPPHRLERLSAEFVLPSWSNAGADAEIIQFASGLEVLEEDGSVVVAYGINDCEGAAVHVDQSVVEKMLQPVPAGKEVVDLMEQLKTR